MSTLMYLKMLFVGTGITGIGVGLYKNTVPTEEQIVKVLYNVFLYKRAI